MGSGDQTQVTKFVWCHLAGPKTFFRSLNSKTSVVLIIEFLLSVLEYARQTSFPTELRFLDYPEFPKGFYSSPQLPLSFRESDCHQEALWEMVTHSLTFTATFQLLGI